MTEPTPKHYRLLNPGETIREGDEYLSFSPADGPDKWESVTTRHVDPNHTVRRPIQSFVEADPDLVAFNHWSRTSGEIEQDYQRQAWFAALAYARGKKG